MTQNTSSLFYQNISVTNENNVIINQALILPFFNAEYPSISVRNYAYGNEEKHCDMVVSYVNEDRSGFSTSLLNMNSSEINIICTDSIFINQNPLPSVDDVHIRSCAIVWQNKNEIFYGQNVDGIFTTLPPIPVSTTSDIPKSNPNVCYKTFRWDIFDVIWTEGSEPPYDIMYRRMEKRYAPLTVPGNRFENHQQKNFRLFQNYPNPFNNATNKPIEINRTTNVKIEIYDINGNRVRILNANDLKPGLHNFPWDATGKKNNLFPSGIYFVKASTRNSVLVNKLILVR